MVHPRLQLYCATSLVFRSFNNDRMSKPPETGTPTIKPPSNSPEAGPQVHTPPPRPPSWKKAGYRNPPDAVNPDPATLRDQWRYAIRQYSKCYSSAWGAAILAGASFFALGWIVKGGNPLPSLRAQQHDDGGESPPPPPPPPPPRTNTAAE